MKNTEGGDSQEDGSEDYGRGGCQEIRSEDFWKRKLTMVYCKSGCSRLKMKVIRRHLKVTSRPSERGKRRRWQIVN